MTHVVVNGDDLGITQAVNAAIARAFSEGILTSASLMANMPAFDDAVETVIEPNARLGVGIHLVLTSGACVSDPRDLPLLVDDRGVFRHGFFGVRRLVRGVQATTALAQIERELRAQCEKVFALGFAVDHLDGHRHIHMIPEIWRIVVRLASDYGCPYVRLADERWSSKASRRRVSVTARNLPKKILLSNYARRNRSYLSRAVLPNAVRTADHIIGILDSDAITSDNLGALLCQASSGITEIIVHPGFARDPEQEQPSSKPCDTPIPCASMDFRFVWSANRQLELEALTSPFVLEIAARRDVHLTSFGELAAKTPRAA
jgi:chitin disaccharide deacetylase